MSFLRQIRKVLLLFVLCVPVALSACGGGSGGGSTVVPPTAPSDDPLAGIIQIDPADNPGPVPAAAPEPLLSTNSGAESEYASLASMNHYFFRHINLAKAYSNIYSQNTDAGGRPGMGARIGFIDTGIDTAHPSFAGRDIDVFLGRISNDQVPIVPVSGYIPDGGADHGTAVAGIAAGIPATFGDGNTNYSFQGVAPDADITMLAILLGTGGGTITVRSQDYFLNRSCVNPPCTLDYHLAHLFRFMLTPERNIDALNNSFGISGNIEDFTEEGLRRLLPGTIAALEQIDRGGDGREEKAVIVWAAGNHDNQLCTGDAPSCISATGRFNGSSPLPFSALMARIEELREVSVVVISTSSSGGRASFSHKCGIAAQWCIAAPGISITVPSSARGGGSSAVSRSIASAQGTSVSAPIVAGSIALLKQMFRGQMTNVELLNRLFETADKTGFYAPDTDVDGDGTNDVSSIYGQGLLDVGAATEPVGDVMVARAGAGSVGAGEGLFSSLYDTAMLPARPFGDSVQNAFDGKEIVAFDSLGAPFWVPAGALTSSQQTGFLGSQLRGFMDFPSNGMLPDGAISQSRFIKAKFTQKPRFEGAGGGSPSGLGLSAAGVPTVYASVDGSPVTFSSKTSHLDFVRNQSSLGIRYENGFGLSAFASAAQEERAVSGAVFSYRPSGLPFGVRSGWIVEEDSVFGGYTEGAFGSTGAVTGFAGVEFERSFGNWRIFADAEAGSVSASAGNGLIGDMSGIVTAAFGAGVVRSFSGGSLVHISARSPLRVERGGITLNLPAGRTQRGAITRDLVTAGLSPSGRQVDLGARAVVPVSVGSVSVGAVLSRHPGHNESAAPSYSLLAGYSFGF